MARALSLREADGCPPTAPEATDRGRRRPWPLLEDLEEQMIRLIQNPNGFLLRRGDGQSDCMAEDRAIAFAVAIGGKADVPFCIAYVR